MNAKKNLEVTDAEIVTEQGNAVAVEYPKEEKKKDNLDEIVAFLRSGNGYLLAMTVLKNGKLTHHLLTENFPNLDILKSIYAAEQEAVERLKKI
jgi:hypothetical protein